MVSTRHAHKFVSRGRALALGIAPLLLLAAIGCAGDSGNDLDVKTKKPRPCAGANCPANSGDEQGSSNTGGGGNQGSTSGNSSGSSSSGNSGGASGSGSGGGSGSNGGTDPTGGTGSNGGGSNGGGSNGGGSNGSAGSTGGSDPSGSDPPLPGASANPFEGASLYVNPTYAASVAKAAADAPAEAALISKVKGLSTAIWLDVAAKVSTVGPTLDDALAQQRRDGKPVTTVFVVYDLPNRDCAANSSNGEYKVEDGGLAKYKAYVDGIAKAFRAHTSQRIVAVVEPDSLGNLVTNLSLPKCAASDSAYREGIAYAISKLSAANVYLYVDAAHAGWLGWDANRPKAAALFKEVLTAAGGVDKIRGFATNVANYNVVKIGSPSESPDPISPTPDEASYIQRLSGELANVGITNKGFLVDTSRNGRGMLRAKWGSWCNVKGAGLGERPRANPMNGVDAYYYVKPPGESDGVSDPSAPRYDAMCSSPDSTTGAPQAGEWFQSFFVTLVKNANPPL
jgi:cellulose 1,4-beta-cellobiosidase